MGSVAYAPERDAMVWKVKSFPGGKGIQVRYLKIIEKSGYQALPWVRYITMAGEYELRLI
ncbi:AP-1 complex subunit mu-2 [Zea mays]|uniref:AP-1 complex subunit mu-2 n=1 Tax=Zea mays TaxID=4577 RepID=A0A1D6QGI2_MAIZE|nr:AP-1 complex subunit mu-2 [Zea mays]